MKQPSCKTEANSICHIYTSAMISLQPLVNFSLQPMQEAGGNHHVICVTEVEWTIYLSLSTKLFPWEWRKLSDAEHQSSAQIRPSPPHLPRRLQDSGFKSGKSKNIHAWCYESFRLVSERRVFLHTVFSARQPVLGQLSFSGHGQGLPC